MIEGIGIKLGEYGEQNAAMFGEIDEFAQLGQEQRYWVELAQRLALELQPQAQAAAILHHLRLGLGCGRFRLHRVKKRGQELKLDQADVVERRRAAAESIDGGEDNCVKVKS